ncbi:hypothetical protein COLO4_28499 [Corchorus olitorius]|uniref:F-box domain-containing protein n=1 Tax=Corchorus olitorius TaxID=93759 RepID=A0A1R3HKE0_9ROSI|nr:hypothetical protein COLO4_28499 [Corchorus olitorius]
MVGGSSDEEMIPIRRVKKRCSKSNQESGEDLDRISNLTDELIHKIMSFMNPKYAVQTCVLSKRWESLWKSLPYLDFNLKNFPFKGVPFPWEDQNLKGFYSKAITSFINFITNVLFRRHHTNLVEVCAQSLYMNKYDSILQGLIAYALNHNVKQLSIRSECSGKFVLPRSLYTCRSLEALHLTHHNITSLKFVALPALKSLHLHELSMGMLESVFKLNLSGCPNLEILKVTNLFGGEKETLFVNAPSLKRLEISFFRTEAHYVNCRLVDMDYGCKVVIDAPGLITLKYSGYGPIECSSGHHASVDDAFFDLYAHKCVCGYHEMYREHALLLINTFKAIRPAKSLTLSLDTVELKSIQFMFFGHVNLVLALFPSLLDENQMPFANLKNLEIKPTEGQQSENVKIPACSFYPLMVNVYYPTQNVEIDISSEPCSAIDFLDVGNKAAACGHGNILQHFPT